MNGYVSEIYATVQGEGLFTGERQVFLRLAGCPLRCDYCDTPESLSARSDQSREAGAVVKEVLRLCAENGINTVSVTGGEPLNQPAFLKEVLPALKASGVRISLETAGVDPERLKDVIAWCDTVSMDIKLPSATGRAFWDEHRRFLEIGGSKIYSKLVLEGQTTDEEIESAVSLLAERRPQPPLVLQPVVPPNPAVRSPSLALITRAFEKASSRIEHVYLMSQKHKEWGIP